MLCSSLRRPPTLQTRSNFVPVHAEAVQSVICMFSLTVFSGAGRACLLPGVVEWDFRYSVFVRLLFVLFGFVCPCLNTCSFGRLLSTQKRAFNLWISVCWLVGWLVVFGLWLLCVCLVLVLAAVLCFPFGRSPDSLSQSGWYSASGQKQKSTATRTWKISMAPPVGEPLFVLHLMLALAASSSALRLSFFSASDLSNADF